MDKDQTIEIISEHIKTRGGSPQEWHVGIGRLRMRLLISHEVNVKRDHWIFIPTNSDQDAREIVDHFIKEVGTDGQLDGREEGIKKVYAYKKIEKTNP